MSDSAIKNGGVELPVQNAESSQEVLEIFERLKTIEELIPAIEEMKAGKGEVADKCLAELENRNLKP